jgi:hypothetical protein
MSRNVRRALLLALASAALLALGTYVAGEQTEVVVLRTFDPQGAPHETKMWVVDHEGSPWVRVANPHRGWYQRIVADPRVELVRGGRVRALRAVPDPSPAARAALDAAFAVKYGVTDAWYGVLLRRGAVPVRLVAAEGNAQ